MSLTATALALAERGRLPDAAIRAGIRHLCAVGLRARRASGWEAQHERESGLLATLRAGPIAVDTRAANEQHYEIPPEFFCAVLGPHRKYSGCYWPAGVTTLAEAEEAALRQVTQRAGLADGQRILELGCGWGSWSLHMARCFPGAQITAVSNSAPQRAYILARAAERGLANLRIITADMNGFAPPEPGTYDRVVSIEMFEHMRNYQELLRRIRSWLRADGALFVHIFAHRDQAYLYEDRGPADWMSRHFFTGGIMPSAGLLARIADDMVLAEQWRQDGTHYQRTANAWLANFDAGRADVRAVLTPVYGPAATPLWMQRWRIFFMACAEMFGYARGQEWGVAHYLFRPR